MHAISYAQLDAAAHDLAALAGVDMADFNRNPAGRWDALATSAEALADVSPPADVNVSLAGHMYRAAVALETLSGTDGEDENPTEIGLLKRIVDALETFGTPGSGPNYAHRLVVAAANAVFEIELAPLTGTFSLAESAIAGAIAGTLSGMTDGSSLSLVDTAGNRVALDGNAIERGATALDYEAATSHNFTVRETHPDAVAPGYRDTVLSLTVTNVLEVTLTDVTGTFAVTEDVSVGTVIGAIGNVNSGAALSLANDASGKVAISGTNLVVGANGVPTPGSYSFTIRQTHADANNSPKDTAFTLTVNAVPALPTRVSRTMTSGSGGSGDVNTGSATGNFMIMVVMLQGGGSFTTPSGWTQVAASGTQAIFRRAAAGANEVVTVSNGGSGDWIAYVTCFTGADQASATLAASVDRDPPSHNAGASRNHYWIAAVRGTAPTTDGPSGYSNHAGTWSPGFLFGMGIADRAVALTQTEDPGAFTGSGSGQAATIAVWKA